MASAVVALALRDAVAGALAVPSQVGVTAWSQSFTPQTVYAPDLELKDVADLRVLVAARARRQTILNRSKNDVVIEVSIGVFQKVATGADNLDKLDQEAIEALLLLCQEFIEAFARFKVTTPDFQVLSVESEPLYDVDKLAEEGRFVGVVVLSFRGSR